MAVRGGKLTVILLIALAVDWVLFFGIGFGVGALSVTGPNQYGGNFLPTYSNGSDSGSGALTFGIWNSVQLTGTPMVSSLTPSGSSTTLTFGVLVSSNGNCGNAGGPVDAIGGVDANYFTIQFLQNNVPVSITANLNGATVQQTTFAVGFNNTNNLGSNNPDLVGCMQAANGNVYSHNLVVPGFSGSLAAYELLPQTFAINGQVGQGTLSIVFHAQGSNCAGSTGTPVNECASFNAAYNVPTSNAGSWTATSTVSIPVISGAASAVLVGAGPWYNNGTLSVDVTTGYGGPGGYNLAMYYPPARAGVGGTLDGNFQQFNVSNQLSNAPFTWTIPAGTSIACTTPGCNEFQIELRSSLFVNAHLNFPIDISPAYAPSNVTIGYADSSGSYYPHPGDTLTLTLTAGSQVKGNAVASFIIQVFYLQPNQDVHSSPGCGSQWITPCNGTTIQATSAKTGTYTGTYTIQLNVPNGMTSVGVIAQAETSIQQSSALTYRTIGIAPLSCSPGQRCDPSFQGLAFWQAWGPVLLIVGLLIAVAVLGLLFSPNPVYTVLAVGGLAVVLLLLYTNYLVPVFQPGGALAAVLLPFTGVG